MTKLLPPSRLGVAALALGMLTALSVAAPLPAPATAQEGLIAYRMVDQWPQRDQAAEGVFQTPIDLDVGLDDRVFIADEGISGVHILLPSGEFAPPFGVTGGFPAQLGRVGAISVALAPAADGGAAATEERVYVLDTALERVVVYDTGGDFVTAWDGINGENVAASTDGRVYVLDRDTSQVRAFDAATGAERFAFGERGTADGQFSDFNDVDVSGDGRVLAVTDRRGDRVQLFDLATEEELAGDEAPAPMVLRRTYDLKAPKYSQGERSCDARRVNALGGDAVFVGQADGACLIDGRDVTFAIASTANSRTICRDKVTLPRLRPATDQYVALAESDPNAGACGNKRTDLDTTPVVVTYSDNLLKVVDSVTEAASNEDLANPILFAPQAISMPSPDTIFVADASSQFRFFSLDGEQVATSQNRSFTGDRTTDFTFFRIIDAAGSDVLGEVFGYYIQGRRTGSQGRPDVEGGIGRFRTVDKLGQQGVERVIEPMWTDPLVSSFRDIDVPALAWNYVSNELLVVRTDVVAQQRTQDTYIARYTAGGRQIQPGFDLPDDGQTNPYADLAVGPDGRIYALDDLADVVRVYEADGTHVMDVPVAFDARAVAGGPSSPDGTVFTLREPGSIERHADDGTITARLDGRPLEFSDPTTLTDIVVDGSGTVYVSDGQSSLISAFVESDDPAEIPIPNDAECLFKGQQSVDPAQLVLGQSTTVTLELAGRCGINEEPADIVVVVPYYRRLTQGVDPSRGTIADLTQLMSRLNFGKHRAAIVSYYNTTTVELELTGDRQMYMDAVQDVTRFDPPNQDLRARLRNALEDALALYDMNDGRRKVMVLVNADYCSVENEFRPGQCAGYPPAEDAALAVRQAGVTIVVAGGFGARHLASSDEDALRDVRGAHRRMVLYTPPLLMATDFELTDTIPSNIAVDPASISGPGVWTVPDITWRLDRVDFDGATFTASLTPTEAGTWPVSEAVAATLTDGWGNGQTVEFPIPLVDVGSDVPATPPAPEAATVYLPMTQVVRCAVKPVALDVALALDISSSMNAPSRAGGVSKIEAARDAAAGFVDALRDIDRVAVVAFDENAVVVSGLTSDLVRVRGMIDALSTGRGTRIDRGLVAATDVLAARRDDAEGVLILMTDGVPSDGADLVVPAAEDARAAGVTIYTIGLGPEIDAQLLVDV
ncbi:MAG: VWA domain-containing protein, partial [Anaerolineae bacterium]